ncbi:DUF3515 domain-containing protein [Nocardioides caldifontis]|uniref:DUF3515 domain-containing protein n=1 Tax=Nocardioides caldifontis TaxID=2588938 RepID=UPI001396AF82|nr:DUF3515 domain-containing protein [Nocardioides caldifontis]
MGVVCLVGLVGCGPGTVEVDPPEPEGRAAAACASLVDALPQQVADLDPREVEPADALGAAWGDPAIVLTCDDQPPAGFDELSSCTTVEDVDWYLPEEQVEVDDPGDVTMSTVNREAFVHVQLPAEHWPPATAMVDLADAISSTLEVSPTLEGAGPCL